MNLGGRRELWEYAVHGPRVLRAEVIFRLRRVHHGRLPWIRGHRPRIVSRGDVHVGSFLRVDGIQTPAEFGATRGARLDVGDRVRFARGAKVLAQRHIEIGDDVRVGEYAAVMDSDLHAIEEGRPVRIARVCIHDNVWIGRGATIMPGVEIGEHSVVAAGSVVTHDVPPRTLVAGVPARVVREIDASERWRRT